MSASVTNRVECTFSRSERMNEDSRVDVVGVVASSVVGLSRMRKILSDGDVERVVRAFVIVSVAWAREGEVRAERPFVVF